MLNSLLEILVLLKWKCESVWKGELYTLFQFRVHVVKKLSLLLGRSMLCTYSSHLLQPLLALHGFQKSIRLSHKIQNSWASTPVFKCVLYFLVLFMSFVCITGVLAVNSQCYCKTSPVVGYFQVNAWKEKGFFCVAEFCSKKVILDKNVAVCLLVLLYLCVK